ncbi:hypothetical protein EYC80_003989 [Monilinia laxa]|nr:hypothetical protein EYC80_003989 [Monilinia laxa]
MSLCYSSQPSTIPTSYTESPLTMKPNIFVKGRQTWLDGLRGIAAAIVAWFHFTSGEMEIPFRSFWDEPAEQNRRLIQLAPFRIAFAGQAMVSLFFVVSGYSISLAIIRYRDIDENLVFYRKLTSSVFRRGFRLYLPLLTLYLISHVAFYIGLYDWEFGESEGCPAAKPWSNPFPHLDCLAMSFMTNLNLAGPYSTSGLNMHLWTVQSEFQGSLALYLTILGLASTKPRVRLGVVCFLSLIFLWFGQASFICFFAGLSLAEFDTIRKDLPNVSFNIASGTGRSVMRLIFRKIVTLALFAFGIYLLCLPSDERFPADFSFQTWMKLPFWVDEHIRIICWYAIGAVLVVATLRNHPTLRIPLESRLAQYLGKISFSLYLIHLTIFRTLRDHILDGFCEIFWKKDFDDTRKDDDAFTVIFLAWSCAIIVILPLLIILSHYMTIFVDQRAIAIAHQLEKLAAHDPVDRAVPEQRLGYEVDF